MNRLIPSLALCLTAAAPAAHAIPVIDQELDAHALGTFGGPQIVSSNVVYQTFTVGVEGTLASVEVQALQGINVTPTDDLVISVLATLPSGVPDINQVLGSVSLAPNELPEGSFTEDAFTSADFSSFAIDVDPGDVLAIRLHTDDVSNGYFWFRTDNSTYPGGEQYLQDSLTDDAFVIGNEFRDDHGFRTFVTPVPEPTSLALLSLGGLLVARRRA